MTRDYGHETRTRLRALPLPERVRAGRRKAGVLERQALRRADTDTLFSE